MTFPDLSDGGRIAATVSRDPISDDVYTFYGEGLQRLNQSSGTVTLYDIKTQS